MDYKIKKGDSIALIPARGGSKGVPQKNIKRLGGYPLIAYSIAVCEKCNSINRVIVSTDSEEIALISREYGAEVPFLRPKELAGDMSEDYGFIRHALDWLQEKEGGVPEYIVHIRPTTPLRDSDIIDEAINCIINNYSYTSLRSGHEASESPYKWFLRLDNGCFKSIKEDISNEHANTGRQNFPLVYIPDGYVDVIRSEFALTNGILHGPKMYGFVSPNCIEVDTLADFHILEYELSNNTYELIKYMKERY